MLAVIDLAANLNGSFPGDAAIYDRTDLGASGSGNIESFVRVGATGVEEGFNSSFRPTQMNEDSTLTFNHDLQLAAVPIVVIGGVSYREFLLDTNEPGGTDRFISLNKLEIYLSSAGSITAYPFNDATGPTATKIYDMDAGTAGTDTASPSPNGNWVLIDNTLGPGSGAANIFVYIPNSLFDASLGTFVTLYSQFGVTVPASSGSEEWAVREATALFSISGRKFNDLDADHTDDGGTDPGLQGWTIYIDSNNNSQLDVGEPSTVTAADGTYTLGSLIAGTYEVCEVQQAGWTQTFPQTLDGCHTVTVGPNATNINFGNNSTVATTGAKFNDLDGDGTRDAGEPGLLNWEIRAYADANGNSLLDQGEFDGGAAATALTNASGDYQLLLNAGAYVLVEVQQTGWTQTFPAGASVLAVGLNTGAISLGSRGYALTLATGQNVAGLDFGNFDNVDLSGQKFHDLDGDGIQDAGESGLVGWTIQLDVGANGTVDAATTTDASGNYSFTNLGPGTYRIREVQQAGWVQTTANPADVVAVGGTSVGGVDFGNFQLISISGQKFNDLDGDGVQDAGESGLINWTIQLDVGANGTVDATTTTDSSGNYTFAGLGPGIYRLREVQQAGWMQTTANPADVLAVSGQNITGADFGNFQLISISGQKFNDVDGDGIQDAGEPGLGNWTIQLDLGANGTVDATTTTDASGNYSFTNLGPGIYRVREVQQAGWMQTTANPADVTAVSGQLVVGLNFGNFQLIDITGQKFNDLDGDGIQDAGELGLAGVTITLDIGADGTIDATTVTGAGGSYSFANLPPGVYRIREVVPAGAIQTTANPADIVATSGSDVSGVDFGNFTLITLSGQKFHDLDGDGVKEAGESGLPGWTIQLDIGANGTVDATAVTDALGNYSFANLGPGAYRIREVQQSGWTQTTANPADIVAISGTSVSGIDFGNDQIDDGDGGGIIVIGPDKSPQTNAQVKVVDVATGQILASFLAYEPGFLGGTRVATGDLTGDGIDEIITAPGRGRAPQVRVFTQDGVELTQFRTMAYASSFLGGIHVAVGDVNGDSRNDIITVPGSGKAIVKVFLGQANADPIANTPFKTFYAFAKTFVGGATVRAADMGQRLGSGTFVNSLDGKAEIIVGSGPGAKATVKVFQVQGTPSLARSFNPFSTATSVYKNGVNLEVERLDADAVPDIIVGSENGGNSRIETWIWNTGNATLFRSGWFESYYDSASKIAPSRVAALDTTGDGIAETLATVQGPGGTTGQIRTFDVSSAVPLGVVHATSLNGFAGPYFIAAIDEPSGPVGEPAAEAEADVPLELALTTSSASAPKLDPSGDGALTAMDALLVINALNQQSAGTAPTDAELASLDVNDDGRLTAVDALRVLNELNQAATAAVAALAPATSGVKEDDYAASVDALFAELA